MHGGMRQSKKRCGMPCMDLGPQESVNGHGHGHEVGLGLRLEVGLGASAPSPLGLWAVW
jgi:hypothetical protein